MSDKNDKAVIEESQGTDKTMTEKAYSGRRGKRRRDYAQEKMAFIMREQDNDSKQA